MKKSDLLDSLIRLQPFRGTTHVNRLLDATGMESLERLAEFIEACQYSEWEDCLAHEICAAGECMPMWFAVEDAVRTGKWVVKEGSAPHFRIISAQHVGPEPERYTISQYWQIAGQTPVLTGRYQTNPAYWNVAGHTTWEQHIAGML